MNSIVIFSLLVSGKEKSSNCSRHCTLVSKVKTDW